MSKPKVAFFDFACCEGCQIELTNLRRRRSSSSCSKHVDVVEFREVMTEKDDRADRHRVHRGELHPRGRSGAPRGDPPPRADRDRVRRVRDDGRASTRSRTTRPTTASSCTETTRGMPHLDSHRAQPISAAIKVDYCAHGCPVNNYEVLQIVSHLLHGKEPVIPNYPVCVECKRRETICRYDEGDHCMGQVARAGCGAPCPADGIPCEACRGFVDDPNQAALLKVLIRRADLSGSGPRTSRGCLRRIRGTTRNEQGFPDRRPPPDARRGAREHRRQRRRTARSRSASGRCPRRRASSRRWSAAATTPRSRASPAASAASARSATRSRPSRRPRRRWASRFPTRPGGCANCSSTRRTSTPTCCTSTSWPRRICWVFRPCSRWSRPTARSWRVRSG